MAIGKINIEEFLMTSLRIPVLDVRSPGEYSHAHIPGAISFPLFSDEERKEIGTTYKQDSREKAIKKGLNYFGKNMVEMVEAAEKIISAKTPSSREIAVHCWRGGMRSAAVAWLLDLYGYKVTLLNGGYKAYRNWVLKQFEMDYDLCVIGGYTGSNKTAVLMEFIKQGHQVIDLEKLASHKGSAFGSLGMGPQPSQEHFENQLATWLNKFHTLKKHGPIWIEGESQRLGNLNIPISFFKTLRSQPLLFLEIPFEQRLSCIVDGYGKYEKEKIMNAVMRIKKRLGGLETKNAINFLLEDDMRSCFSILLKYYDKWYHKSTFSGEPSRAITYVKSDSVDSQLNFNKIIQTCIPKTVQ